MYHCIMIHHVISNYESVAGIPVILFQPNKAAEFNPLVATGKFYQKPFKKTNKLQQQSAKFGRSI